MAVEGFEDGAQKSVGQQHAGRGHVYDGDAFLDRDGLEDILALRSARGDARAFAGGIARVQHVDRNIFLDGGQDRGRVQDFRAEVGELGGFVEADDFDAAGVGADAGVGGENAVHVGPDLDAVGVEARAEDGGGEIGAAAADGGGDAGAVGADEAAHDRHFAFVQQRLHSFLQAGVGFFILRHGLHVGVVGDQDVARVHVQLR